MKSEVENEFQDFADSRSPLLYLKEINEVNLRWQSGWVAWVHI